MRATSLVGGIASASGLRVVVQEPDGAGSRARRLRRPPSTSLAQPPRYTARVGAALQSWPSSLSRPQARSRLAAAGRQDDGGGRAELKPGGCLRAKMMANRSRNLPPMLPPPL